MVWGAQATVEFYYNIYTTGGRGTARIDASSFMADATYRLTQTMRKYADKVKTDLQFLTRPWNMEVKFDIDIDKDYDTFSITISTQNDIFRFLNDGTEVRYATMTKDFLPKTQPWKTYSKPGRGGMAYINKRMPRHGIQARHFIDAAFESWSGFCDLEMERVFNTVLAEHWERAF